MPRCQLIHKYKGILFFSITLHPVHSRVDRGNLVLRYSVLHFAAKFWRHGMLSGGTQLRALPRHHSEGTKILNISFLRVGLEPINIGHEADLYKKINLFWKKYQRERERERESVSSQKFLRIERTTRQILQHYNISID